MKNREKLHGTRLNISEIICGGAAILKKMLEKEIKEKALQLGYSGCGIIPALPFEEYRQALDTHVQAFPKSKDLYEPLYGLVEPPEEAKSIIVCIRGYTQYKKLESLKERIGKYYLFSRYPSYSYEQRSKAEFETYLAANKCFIVKASIPVRWAAFKAGLGYFGRNNFFYTQDHGSYHGIDVWAIDKELEYDTAPENTLALGCNENCLKCVQACPSKALSGSLLMDRGKCLPRALYSKETPNEATEKTMGTWMFGCDVCQDVCPLNKGKFTEMEDYPLLSQLESLLQPDAILDMDETTYLRVIYPQFPFAGKDGLPIWKRNALRIKKQAHPSN